MSDVPAKTTGAEPDKSKILRRLLLMLRPHWPAVGLGVVLLLLSAPAELFPAITWGYVTDQIVLNKGGKPLLTRWFSFNHHLTSKYAILLSATAWMFVIYLLGETFETLEQWTLNRVAQKFILSLRNNVYHKLQSQSLSYLQRQRTGDLMSRAMSDVDEVQSFIVGSIDVILSEGILWVLTVAIVMTIDWRVAAASLSPVLLVYVLLRIFNKKVKPIYAAARERLGDVSTRIQENLSGIVVIKIFAREKQEAQRFRRATTEYYDRQLEAINARTLFFPFTRVVGFLSNVFMIGLGGYYMLKDMSFTPGDLVTFRAYWWRLFGPINTLARVNDMVQRATAAAKRVFEVLDEPDELPDATDAVQVDRVRGEMELRDVSFSYERGTGDSPVLLKEEATEHGRGARATVLHDVSIKIEPGKTVALCGPSGSGKSTILNLLLRFYDPVSGVVTLDGRDVRSITRDSLRRHFALVQQESFLFNDSIIDNIRYGHAEATLDEVIAAAKAANAHGFISQLANGYDTKVGERGVRLSGGQKQRISIARAFLANPSILLLDEPTSSVEPDSEAAIIAALDRLMQNRTTIVTSHRPSLILQADWVYVIEDGRVTEQGRPSELAQNAGWFARFIRSATEPAIMVTDDVQ